MVDTIFGKCSIKREEDGTFSSFNHDLYHKIRRKISDDKINDTHFNGHQKGFIPKHEFAPTIGQGMKYVDSDGKTHYIQAMYKHWNRGYYLLALTYTIMNDGNRSHGNIFLKNINSVDEGIIEYTDENKDLVLIESTLQEKLDIIISNRKETNLPCIIHLNKFDAENIDTIDITDKSINIKDLLKKHRENKEPLLLSGGMSWTTQKYTNFDMEVIKLEGFEDNDYSDILYFHRDFEE